MFSQEQKLAKRQELFLKVQKYTEIPMLLLVLIMLGTIVIPLIYTVSEETLHLFHLIDWIIWGAFATELCVKIYLSEKKAEYLRKNWIDLLVVLLPLLRIFRLAQTARLLNSTRFLRLLNVFRIFTLLGKLSQETKIMLSRYGFSYLLITLLGLIIIGASLSYNFDQGTKEGIASLADGLWLAVVAAVSGGFANVYPASPEAKGISVFLVLFGTVIVSYFTASLASYFTEKEQDIEQQRIENKLLDIEKKLDQIEKKISQ